jgi:hypothetical protein
MKVLATMAAAVLLAGSLAGCAGEGLSAGGDHDPTAASFSPATTPTSSPTARHSARQRPTAAKVPHIKGLTLAHARRELKVAGLEIGHVSKRPSRARPGTLLSQDVPIGFKLKRGSKVAVIVAVPLPRVPSVIGQSVRSAVNELRRAGFAVAKRHRTTSSGRSGVVLAQSPAVGLRVRPTATVSIVVSRIVRKRTFTQPTNCTPGYSPCLPPAYDYDCAGGSGDGPKYAVGPITVTGSDPYGLDADGDGVACED